MKKYLSTFILLFCMVMNVHAIDVVVDGIKYEIISTEDLTARVKGYADAEFADVVIPEYIEYYGKQFKVIEIANEAFKLKNSSHGNPSVLSHILLPNTLQTIGESAFENSGLIDLEIPNSVTALGVKFANWSINLKKVIFGRGVKDIPRYGVYAIYSMDYAFIPNSINTIEIAGFTSSNIKELIIEDSNVKLQNSCPTNTGAGTNWFGGDGQPGGVQPTDFCLFSCCNIQSLYLGRNLAVKTTTAKTKNGLPRVENLTVGPYVTDIKGLFNLDCMQRIKLMTSTPPAFDRGLATEECYMRVKVFVPKGSLNAYKSHAEWGKYWNIEEYDDACEAPEISYEDGMLKVTPVTPGSVCYYTISDEDIVTDKEMTGGIQLSGTYNIEAYAMLNGSKSERSYATLCWFDNSFTTDGITQTLNEAKRPILVKSVNGQITVEGTENNEVIDLYTIDGKHVERTSSIGSHATFNTMQQEGQILIIRAGENSIKFVVR